MKITALVELAALSLAWASQAAYGHHSNAMYDHTQQLDITGTVRDYQWTNPHVFIELVIDSPTGPQNYTIEGSAPGVMRSHGWKFNSLKPGDKVVAKVHPLKNGSIGGGLVGMSKDGAVIGDGGNLSPGTASDK